MCGVQITADERHCAKCDTPHHADCWGYTGRCAIYACGNETVRGGLPVPRPASIVIADGSPAPALAQSAERVPAIVPAAGAPAQVWQADASGAWIGARDGTITPAAGERMVMLPPEVLAEVRSPEDRAADVRRSLTLRVAFIATAILGSLLSGLWPHAAKLVLAGGLSLWVAALRAGASVAPSIAWLSAGAKGLWIHGITAGRAWEAQLEGVLRPRRVRLERSYEACATDRTRTLLTYRLVLQWPLHADDTISPLRELAPPLQMPETSEERRPILEQLSARRALGQHIAAALSIPFEEGVRPS